jgi:Ca2+-binding RTX toxin-like protein
MAEQTGTAGDDNLTGGVGDDTISGGEGNDRIDGGDGADVLNGGDGNDTLTGGDGDDVLNGGDGVDTLNGGAGSDTFTITSVDGRTDLVNDFGFGGDILIVGLGAYADVGLGADWAATGSNLYVDGTVRFLANGHDLDLSAVATGASGFTLTNSNGGSSAVLIGSSLDDTLHGFNGDTLTGGAGGDRFQVVSFGTVTITDLGNGADQFFVNYGTANLTVVADWVATSSTRIQGGAANLYTAGFDVDLSAAEAYNPSYLGYNVTNTGTGATLTGSAARDTLTGGDGDDVLNGGDGVDTLNGGAGSDQLIGGLGADQLIGGDGLDTADYGAALAGVIVDLKAGVVSGGAGADSLSGIENITGSVFNDRLTGFTGANVLDGGDGDDQLSGFGDNDSLIGGLGNDLLVGGAGNDRIDGGIGRDKASYKGAIAGGGVTVNLLTGTSSGAQGSDILIKIEDLIGSDFDDVLTGDKGVNQINGGAGDDSLNGGLGIDTVSYAGTASAVMVSLLAGQATGGAGIDQLLGFENIIGSDFNDSLTGDGGDNVLVGGLGNDALNGGAGLDTADYSRASSAVVADLGLGTATLGLETDSLSGIETLLGSKFGDSLTGDLSANGLNGGRGDDQINGGGGSDRLTGGIGKDTFLYTSFADSALAAMDLITDLGAKDRIDLSALDADAGVAGDQTFVQVAAFTGAAGQLRLTYEAGAQQTTLAVDVNGDGLADFALLIAGEHLSAAGWVL